jgi:hypothetical protein
MGRLPPPRTSPAYAAALLAFASAAVSTYWTLGGTALLDTVGGSIEQLARERSTGAIVLGFVVVTVKVVGGVVALALARRWGSQTMRRVLFWVSALGSSVLILYGGTVVIIGALVLGGVIMPSEPIDEHALRWHVFVWDLWFLVWGVALGLAAWQHRFLQQHDITRHHVGY